MGKSLAGRIALVTGASRGIGAATALALGRTGAHVVAVARTVGGLEELDDAVRRTGASATLVPLDLTDFDGIVRLEQRKLKRHLKGAALARQTLGEGEARLIRIEMTQLVAERLHGDGEPMRSA